MAKSPNHFVLANSFKKAKFGSFGLLKGQMVTLPILSAFKELIQM
jgi:hypothetical protein